MNTAVIDGRALADNVKAALGIRVRELKAQHQVTPGLAVIIVGADPASQVYVGSKVKQTQALGMHSVKIEMSADSTQEQLLAEIDRLNADDAIDGILVQLPLPKHMDDRAVIERIDPAKDVDGFHPVNTGRLVIGERGLVPCTPLGCLMMLQQLQVNLQGLNTVIIGRSNIVGKPMAHLLLQEDCTVTIVHSRTPNPQSIVKQADIVVAAVGRPEMITADWIKPGAIVIDVGINRIDAGEGKTKLVGDVAYEEVSQVASAITPVPGGVGPMTIACLLTNTVKAACMRRGLDASFDAMALLNAA